MQLKCALWESRPDVHESMHHATRVCSGPPSRNQRKATIGGAICRFGTRDSKSLQPPGLMMHHSHSRFDSAPHAGFGLLGGSWDAPMGGRGDELCTVGPQRDMISDQDRAQRLKAGGAQYPRAIANEARQGRASALSDQRLDGLSNTGAGFDRGGCTP